MKPTFTFLILSITFCVCLVCSNLFVSRLWSIGIWDLQMSGALLVFPVSYIINDLLTEVYGFRASRLVVWIGFAMCLFVTVASLLVTMLPQPVSEDGIEMAEKFDSVYSFLPRATIGSLLAFVAGSMCNAVIMSKMKVASEGRNFSLRAIVSSVGGELSDSLVFFPIAYAGALPVKEMFFLMATEFVAKILYEILALPLTNFIVRRVKVREGIDVYDEGISYNPFRISDL